MCRTFASRDRSRSPRGSRVDYVKEGHNDQSLQKAQRRKVVEAVEDVGTCGFCLRVAPLEFGREGLFCSAGCYRESVVGRDALDWDAREVGTWFAQNGGIHNWARFAGAMDGRDLMLKINRRMLRQKGMSMSKIRSVISAIQTLRQGAWLQPEPPLTIMPVHTVAIKGKQGNPNWSSVLEDHARRSYAAACPKAIDEETAWKWFEMLHDGLPWQDLTDTHYQDTDKKIPRRTVFVVTDGCSCTYRYSGVQVPPLTEPSFLTEIRKTCARLAGYGENEMPNSCNINLYRDGKDSVGWHSDDEPLFEAEDIDACILSLSLGARRSFQWKEQQKFAVNGEPNLTSLPISHGDLCTMEGKFQQYYLHGVPKEPRVKEPRINLTWRWITRHSGESGCKLHGAGN